MVWALTVCPDCGNHLTGVSLCGHQRGGDGPTGIDFSKMVPVAAVELDPMLDMLERLTARDIDTQEDGGADAIRLLRAHGRLGRPLEAEVETTELESSGI
jgi:hypothetical protein